MRLKYPKIIVFLLVITLSYIVFKNLKIENIFSGIETLDSLGVFIAGMLYSFGLTAPFSAGFFLTLHANPIIPAGIIGGLGAMFADMFVFKFVRFSFKGELLLLKDEPIVKRVFEFGRNLLPKKIRKILLVLLATVLIAAPLPNETGVIVISSLTKVKEKTMAGLSFILNTIGILILLKIGSAI